MMMRGAAVRAPLGRRPYARTKRERVGRAGDIADASAVVCRVRVSVLRFWDRQLALHCVVLVGGFRSKVASEAPADRVDETIGSLPHRACLAKQDSSVTRNTHLETNAHHVLSRQGSTQGRQKLATR